MITDEDFIRLFNACAVLAKTRQQPAGCSRITG
jgi:hypothetical protein